MSEFEYVARTYNLEGVTHTDKNGVDCGPHAKLGSNRLLAIVAGHAKILGKLDVIPLLKRNTFHEYIAACQVLIDRGVQIPEKCRVNVEVVDGDWKLGEAALAEAEADALPKIKAANAANEVVNEAKAAHKADPTNEAKKAAYDAAYAAWEPLYDVAMKAQTRRDGNEGRWE